MIDPAFWNGRRVFLTGHTGFKGAWLSLWLQRLGAETTGYSIGVPTQPSLFEAAQLQKTVTDYRGDIRDLDTLAAAMRKASPEIVIHAAAQSLVRPSYENPLETFSVNILGTANLLEAVRSCDGVRAVLVITSDKCYENQENNTAFRESDPMGGRDPYSASKAAAELVAASMRHSYFHPVQYDRHGVAVGSARAGNVIGGGDWSMDRLVPDLVRAFHAGKPATIRNPDARRPWQFVLDPLAGYLMLCEELWRGPQVAEAWNFGPDPDCDVPVAVVAQTAARLWGGDAAAQIVSGAAPHEAGYLRLDASKARERLGWKPKCDFDHALELTVSWYRSWYGGADARLLCERQIDDWALSI